jgi:hypothetical protein
VDATGVPDAWMNRHGSLDEQLQARFLARPELTILCDLPVLCFRRSLPSQARRRQFCGAFTALDDFPEEDTAKLSARRERCCPSSGPNAGAQRTGRPSSEPPKRSSGRREWRQFNPLSLRDPEAPASLYLISSEHHRALKIGVTAGARMDQFEVDGWEVLRVWRFAAGYDAMEVEERVLDRWRNVLSTRAPVAPEDMPDHGYSETTRDGRGARSDIVSSFSATRRWHSSLNSQPIGCPRRRLVGDWGE